MKIAVAMSGGVDSSVAAKILRDEGHEVIGLFLKLWSDPSCKIEKENRCCDYEALDDARKVATKLGIPFYVINARDQFKKEVVDYFLEEYKNLRTPNPCIVCNHKIKFGLLLQRALEIGCDKLATGHYARIEDAEIPKSKIQISNEIHPSRPRREPRSENPNPKKLEAISYELKAGIDVTKDQSYMLYHLNQNQLGRILFPLGEMTKKEVRKLALKWNLPVKEKPESQEICFFGDRDYRTFLKRYLPEKYFKSGKIVDKKGNVLGEHLGLINYTIGQRKGIDQSQTSALLGINKISQTHTSGVEPLYVIGFDVKNNKLIVGEDKDVYSKEMIVTNVNWIQDLKSNNLKSNSLDVKIRYRHESVPCKISNLTRFVRGKPRRKPQHCYYKVVFAKSERAVTSGQSAVFYLGKEVIGGGIIKQ